MMNVIKNNFRTVFYMWGKRMIIFFAVPIFMAYYNSYSDFLPFYTIFGMLIVFILPELEARDSVYMSYLSTPCRRSDYVFGRYAFLLIWMVIVLSSGLLINFILSIITPDKISMIEMSSVKITPAYMLILLSIYYFIYFTFNVKAAKATYIISFLLIMMSSWLQTMAKSRKFFLFKIKWISDLLFGTAAINNVLYVVILLAIVLLFANLSLVTYSRRDL